MAQSKHACTPPLPAHRCTDHDCIYLGQPSSESCACHKTREQMLVEQNAGLLAALADILFEDSGKSEEARLLTRIKARAALARATTGGAS